MSMHGIKSKKTKSGKAKSEAGHMPGVKSMMKKRMGNKMMRMR